MAMIVSLTRDVILYWTDETKRIVTGVDILGRLLQGIVKRDTPKPVK